MSHDVNVCRQETGMRCTPNVHTITEIRPQNQRRTHPRLTKISHLSDLKPLSSATTHLPPPRSPFYRHVAPDRNPWGHSVDNAFI